MSHTDQTAADKAVAHIIRQMYCDGRLTYLIGWGSQTFALLTEAYAEKQGLDITEFRRDFEASYAKPEAWRQKEERSDDEPPLAAELA